MTAFRLGFRKTFSSIRHHRNYRLFFFGQVVSVAGTWMQNVALAWLILTLTHSVVSVGILAAARFGPYMLFGLFGGVLADRLDNRRAIMGTQSVQLLGAVGLAALSLSGVITEWEVYLLAIIAGFAQIIDTPSRQALTYQLVGRNELANAVALNSTLFNVGRIAGPAIAGLLIAGVGSGWCFALNAASFLAVLAALWMMNPRATSSRSTATTAPSWYAACEKGHATSETARASSP